MKDKNAESKLGTSLVPGEKDQTCTSDNSASPKARPRFKIKFTDYAIEKFVSSFIDPKTIKDLYPSLLEIKNNYNFESFKKT